MPDTSSPRRLFTIAVTAGGPITGATGPVTIVTAGAAGPAQQQAATTALTAAATAPHRSKPTSTRPPAPDTCGEGSHASAQRRLRP